MIAADRERNDLVLRGGRLRRERPAHPLLLARARKRVVVVALLPRPRVEDRLREASERLLEWGALAGDLLQSALALRGASPCPLLQVLEGFVKTRQRAGELRRSLPPESAARLTAGVLGAMLVDGRTGDPGTRVDRCEASLALLMNGMREPKPRLKWSAPG